MTLVMILILTYIDWYNLVATIQYPLFYSAYSRTVLTIDDYCVYLIIVYCGPLFDLCYLLLYDDTDTDGDPAPSESYLFLARIYQYYRWRDMTIGNPQPVLQCVADNGVTDCWRRPVMCYPKTVLCDTNWPDDPYNLLILSNYSMSAKGRMPIQRLCWRVLLLIIEAIAVTVGWLKGQLPDWLFSTFRRTFSLAGNETGVAANPMYYDYIIRPIWRTSGILLFNDGILLTIDDGRPLLMWLLNDPKPLLLAAIFRCSRWYWLLAGDSID